MKEQFIQAITTVVKEDDVTKIAKKLLRKRLVVCII